MQKLRILARAEIALARIRAQRTGYQAALFAVAALFALFGLVLLNLAAYQAHPAFSDLVYFGDDLFLSTSMSQGTAALGCTCSRCPTIRRTRNSPRRPPSWGDSSSLSARTR